jgi:hypothetical protein
MFCIIEPSYSTPYDPNRGRMGFDQTNFYKQLMLLASIQTKAFQRQRF